MDLLLLRHGIAKDPQQFRGEDSERPLTAEGIERMQLQARGMRVVLEAPLMILTSPFLRTRQTAELVAAEFASAPIEELAELAMGGSVKRVLAELATREQESKVMLVGHEPELVELVTLLTGIRSESVRLKKGSLVALRMLSFEPRPRATLRWQLSPSQQQTIGRLAAR
ncbi:MAG: phosphohistidine phosphatase SixA [Proteobacteria bacterium]|nr:phosphohistidine phosphatase SixA [Pseudomonadota bacterium]